MTVEWIGKVSKPNAKSMEIIKHVVDVTEQYDGAITLRQLYYQLVSANVIANEEKAYDSLIERVAQARKLGYIPFDAIIDRGRSIDQALTFDDAGGAVDFARKLFDQDRWVNQAQRVAVIIEKDALTGVVEPICREWQVPFIASKGNASLSLIHDTASRLDGYHFFYLGDLDPTGVTIPKQWEETLAGFGACFTFEVLGLNAEQVQEHNLVPQVAKKKDANYRAFVAEHGPHSYELDALPPYVLSLIVEDAIRSRIDSAAWDERALEIERERMKIINTEDDDDE